MEENIEIGFVYKIVSPANRVYIGQTLDVNRRLDNYRRIELKTQPKIRRSIEKYGFEAHVFEVITGCRLADLNEWERYWQDYYDVLKSGLNCRLTTSKSKSGKMSEEAKLKMAVARVGRRHSPESLLKLSAARKLRTISEETKQKISTSLKGLKPSPETRAKMSAARKGRKPHNQRSCKDNVSGKTYISALALSLSVGRKYSTVVFQLRNPRNTRFTYL